MQLPGRLGATTLGDLLGALYRERATGILRLVEQNGTGRSHEVSLRMGLVSSVATELPTSRLGDLLCARGVIDEAVRRGAEEKALGSPGARFGALLQGQYGVPGREIVRALRVQLRARLDALYSLVDARISFHVARRREDAGPMPLLASEFLHGRARRRDGGVREATAPRPGASGTPVVVDTDRASALSLFGLDASATRRDITRRFRVLAQSLHPDRIATGSAVSRDGFARLSAAYHRLIDCR